MAIKINGLTPEQTQEMAGPAESLLKTLGWRSAEVRKMNTLSKSHRVELVDQEEEEGTA